MPGVVVDACEEESPSLGQHRLTGSTHVSLKDEMAGVGDAGAKISIISYVLLGQSLTAIRF